MATVRKKRPQAQDEQIVEKGDIFFFYRPRVEHEEADGLEDIQRFFMVLKPEGAPFRVAVLGRKRLPDPDRHERIWGFVDHLAKRGDEVEADLKEQHYTTKTRGERTLPPARPAGEGVYALVQRGRNLYLTYELELPEKPGEVQQAPPQAGLPERDEADYPTSLQREFRGRRFASEDPHLLDYEGAEFVLIGARSDPERAYGVEIEAEHETADKADIFRKLKLSRREHPVEPLFEGEWR